MRGISIVVPAFNSSGTLAVLTERICETFVITGLNFELILVNDGSKDKTWEVIRTLVSRYDWVTGVRLSRNFGQHNALVCGIFLAQFETCVTIDDDLQHPPEEISKLTRKLDQGYDLVYGVPVVSRHKTPKRFWATLARFVGENLFFIDRSPSLSAFRAFRTNLRDGFGIIHGPFVSLDVLLSLNNAIYGRVGIKHAPRLMKKSNYNVIKMTELSLTMLRGFNPKLFTLIVGSFFLMAVTGMGIFLRYTLGIILKAEIGFQDLVLIALAVTACGILVIFVTTMARHLFRFFLTHRPTAPYVVLETLKHPGKK
ncbi:MAG: glycosyltransferase family 2 protein [Pseudomonadota bacterium]